MEEGGSFTAEGVAALRADHALHDRPVVFDDRAVLPLLSDELREGVLSGNLHRTLTSLDLRPTQGHLVARARIADDALRGCVARGTLQCVILGAGLDTTALRRDPRVRVFEVDHPASQATKRERLARLPGPGLDGVEFAAVDFTREELADGLLRTRYDPALPSFVSWLGVTMYLSEAQARATLDGLRRCTAPGSELVLDYPLPPERLSPEFRAIAERKNAELASRGEPRVSSYDPEALEALLADQGFEVLEHLSSPDLDARLFAARADGLRANPEHAVARARRVG